MHSSCACLCVVWRARPFVKKKKMVSFVDSCIQKPSAIAPSVGCLCLMLDIHTQLPPKRRQRIPLDVKVSSEAMKELEELRETLRASNKGDFEGLKALSKMYPTSAAAKLPAVRQYLMDLFENTEYDANSPKKYIVFGHHQIVLDAVEALCVRQKLQYIRIDGRTPLPVRKSYVDKFQSDPVVQIAVLSMTAAGQGLTLTAASTVIFAELHWTPGVIQQAEDRAHRIGQKSCVNCVFLVAKNTLDDIMWPLIARKVRVLGTALDGIERTMDAKSVAAPNETENTKNWDAADDQRVLACSDNSNHAPSARNEESPTASQDESASPVKGDVRWFFLQQQPDNRKRSRSPRTTWECLRCTSVIPSKSILSCTVCGHKRQQHTLKVARKSPPQAGQVLDISGAETIDLCSDDTASSDTLHDSKPVAHIPTNTVESQRAVFTFSVSKATGRIFLHSHSGAYLQQNFSTAQIDSDDALIDEAIRCLAQKFLLQWRHLRAPERALMMNVPLKLPLRAELQRYKLARKGGVAVPSLQRYSAAVTPPASKLSRPSSFFVTQSPKCEKKKDNAAQADTISPPSKKPCAVCAFCKGEMPALADPSCQSVAAWQSTYCSYACAKRQLVRLSGSEIRRQLFEMEKGICQICSLDAHSLWKQVCIDCCLLNMLRFVPFVVTYLQFYCTKVLAVEPPERLALLQKHNFKVRAAGSILTSPKAGDFWQADHIIPVSEGGGECDMDNFRTLCSKCHAKETEVLRQRLKLRPKKSLAASGAGMKSITDFFTKTS